MAEPDSVKDMESGVSQTERLCARMWRWFKMPTTGTRTRRYTEQQVGADGVTRSVQLSEDITERMSIVIELNTQWYQKQNRYPSVDIVYANGLLNLPSLWSNPNLFDPAVAVSQRENELGYYSSRDAWTFTLGYETEVRNAEVQSFSSRAALPQFGCARAEEQCERVCTNFTNFLDPTGCSQVCTLTDMLAEMVWVGVRCSWGVGKVPCYFDLEYTLLPRHMSDGDALEAVIGPGETHYFVVELGPFDVLAFELTRRGVLDDNFDLTEESVDGVTRAPAGHGIIGWFLGARDRCPRREETMEGAPTFRWPTGNAISWPKPGQVAYTGPEQASPPPSPLHAAAIVDSADEVGGPFGLTFFCTQEAEQGRYAFAVAAAEELGPFERPFEPSKGGGSNCKDGFVGPEGRPLLESYGSPGALPACNPHGNNNEMKANVGRYNLTLRHRSFEAGALSGQEVRPGCASYGQWRRYTVTSTSTRDANIYVQLSVPVSALLLRAGGPPTLVEHDRMIGPESTALTLSPCDLSRANVWHIAYYIAPEAEQGGGGVATSISPVELTLTVQLQDAQVASGSIISPRADGGDGFVCCGAMKLFLVPITSALKALQVSVNVTAGAIRAVFLKHKECPVLPGDIQGDQCVGLCHMSWYASYDRFSGALQYARATTTRVPKGDQNYPDKRAAGDWYIGIEASDATTTEFRMEVEVINHGMAERDVDCDRFGRFACGNEVWEVPRDIEPVAEWDADIAFFSDDVTEISAAAQLAGGRSAALRASGVSSACTCALLSGWGLWIGILAVWRTRRASSSRASSRRRRLRDNWEREATRGPGRRLSTQDTVDQGV